jgi:hypothetical protein
MMFSKHLVRDPLREYLSSSFLKYSSVQLRTGYLVKQIALPMISVSQRPPEYSMCST